MRFLLPRRRSRAAFIAGPSGLAARRWAGRAGAMSVQTVNFAADTCVKFGAGAPDMVVAA